MDLVGEQSRVLLSYATFILLGIIAGVGGVLIPEQIADYGVDKTTIGLMFITFSAGYMLSGVVTGTVIDRYGIRAALLLGGGCFIMAALITGLHPSFGWLVVLQLLGGFGVGQLDGPPNAYLATVSNANARLNRLHAFFGVGALLGPLLAAGLLRVGLPWQAVWLVLGALCLPLIVGMVVLFPGRVAIERPVARPEEKGLLRSALGQAAVWLSGTFLMLYVGLEVSMGNWAYTLMVEERGQSTLLAGYAVSGYWLGLTLGRFMLSAAANRLRVGVVAFMFACVVGSALGTLITWFGSNAAVAGLGLATLGFFLGPLFPTTITVLPRLTAVRLVPTVIGILVCMAAIGGAIFPWLAGALAQRLGVWSLLPFSLGLAVVLAGCWWRIAVRLAPVADPV